MRHDPDFAANARLVVADELAQIVDAMKASGQHWGFHLPHWLPIRRNR